MSVSRPKGSKTEMKVPRSGKFSRQQMLYLKHCQLAAARVEKAWGNPKGETLV
ncbi:hypothetical protein [Rahnella aceris]|uniref:hypothetical protein n=1 Tax=Rahnella sp. (strain Y9602) TaxID=2703885 RepID=UPI001C2630A2|nr:hypothetical protein [Rahnella aceris]MBU9848883.1 hypothetical protein [Rahnella aceris]